MSLPSYKQFVDPLLRALVGASDGLKASDATDQAATALGLTEEQRAERNRTGQLTYKNRCAWAHDRLKRAGLSESVAAGLWKITEEGRAYAADNPNGLPESELSRLCNLQDESDDDPDAKPPADVIVVPPNHRTWLIALGRNADRFEECVRDGVIAIGWDAVGDLSRYKFQEEVQDILRKQRTDGVDPRYILARPRGGVVAVI